MKKNKRQSDKITNKRNNNLLDTQNKDNSKRTSESSSNMDCK